MESAPLALAHFHARNAAIETKKSNSISASEEHDLAAGEFASAARTTGDPEALRTLKLLEQHHQKLSDILKYRPKDIQVASTITSESQSPQTTLTPQLQIQPKTLESSPRHVSQNPQTPVQLPHRDLTSSIASNLASARGIPSNRQRRGNQSPAALSPQLAEGKVLNPRRQSKLGEQELKPADIPSPPPSTLPRRPSNLSPAAANVSSLDITQTSPTSPSSPPSQPVAPSDDSFSRFYATFEGFISKLSAPLAFAGLPLTPEPPPPPSHTPATRSKKQMSSQPPLDPDITRLFSRAALRAVRDEHGLATAAESFYVIPPTGGTMSYRDMLSASRNLLPHPPSLSRNTTGNTDDEFVDARETPHPSPEMQRRGAGRKLPSGKTMEELAVENETLKAVAIDLGDRLRAFEMGAQRSSMALHMSMRAMASPTTSTIRRESSEVSSGGAEQRGVLESRIKELEEEMERVRKEARRAGRENAKLKEVVDRYRERWEILKDGARGRIKEGEGKAS